MQYKAVAFCDIKWEDSIDLLSGALTVACDNQDLFTLPPLHALPPVIRTEYDRHSFRQ